MSMLSAVVLGAGLGGIAAAVNLRQRGIEDFVVLEKLDGVGGTWRSNTYPGCGCDTQMIAYQFSFAVQNHWASLYPKAPQILQYAEDVVRSFDLERHIRFETEVASLRWDEPLMAWEVQIKGAESVWARTVFAAMGQFSKTSVPAVDGIESFPGAAFHSATWDHDVDLNGKRVAVVGSAASAVQLIPEVARAASALTVFQRTPNWVIPRGDREIGELERELLDEIPLMTDANRTHQLALADLLIWKAFEYSPKAREHFTALATQHLHAQVGDADLRAALTPEYPIGCKRILLSDDFYPALQLPQVNLVADGVAAVSGSTISSSSGESFDVDVIIWATGFDAVGWPGWLSVSGVDGRLLSDEWSQTPETYLGVAVAGFPNFFLAYGPNTNLGHGPVTFMLERQAEYFASMVKNMTDQGIASVTVRPDVVAKFSRELQDRLGNSTWADPRCHSYYKLDSGVITKNWMGSMQEYEERMREVELESYDVVFVAAVGA